MTDLDPRLIAYADDAVRQLMIDVGREVVEGRRDELVQRLAKAIDLACEQEYVALVEELAE